MSSKKTSKSPPKSAKVPTKPPTKRDRRTVPAGTRKDLSIFIRVSSTQKAMIVKRAEKAGMGLATFLRTMGLNGKLDVA